MSSLIVKQEFYKWITSFVQSTLSDIDKKFINLLISNFDEIAPLGNTRGLRAKKIGQLIEEKHISLSSVLPDLSNQFKADSEIHKNISELIIGPFRGFSSQEIFTFDTKYTFMYGPNGSGKSSFCEGLEYTLLGSIEEAEAKRIDITTYIKNAQIGTAQNPIIYGLNTDKHKIVIEPNPNIYRFCFVEKNRIDGFARIAATTPSNQKNRIATLFGLDAFSEFVDCFTDELDNRYLTLDNQIELEFNAEKQKYEASKLRIIEIDNLLKEQLKQQVEDLIKDISQEKITTFEELKIFLIGEDGTKGIINELHEKKAASIPDDIDVLIIESLAKKKKELQETIDSLNLKISELHKSASEVNFKDLYTAIKSILKDTSVDKSVCPACKTPIDKVTINPFDNAISELTKMGSLAVLQAEIKEVSVTLAQKVREMNKDIEKLNNIKKTLDNEEPSLSLLTEFTFTDIVMISSWKETILNEIKKFEKALSENINILNEIHAYNSLLKEKRKYKEQIDEEITKYQTFKIGLDEIAATQTTLIGEKTNHQTKMTDFLGENEAKLKEIEAINRKIAINNEYVKSYNKLIDNLKKYRTGLPVKLIAGLSDRTKEFYNIINGHDPEFEKIEYLKLPTEAGEKITVRFKSDSKEYDALFILSDGHLKVLGLSILIAKIVNDDLGFIIFDDIVNAIDDEHRDGIAELLLKNPTLKDRQHIITCHGEMFISKLEHKIGASIAGREVKSYRFVPSDIIEERGIKISVGNSKHYLLLAKKSFEEDARKDVASRCRQAIESMSEQLWIKLCKKLNINLTVKMRSPGARPDLSSVVDSLIKELHGIAGLEELMADFRLLKEKYPWSLLNKGTHEQGDLPELERKDVSDLLNLVENIETKICAIKLEITSS